MFDLLTGTIDLFHDESVESIELDGLVGEEGDFHVSGLDPEFVRQFYPDYENEQVIVRGKFDYIPLTGFIRLVWLNLTVGDVVDTDFFSESLHDIAGATPSCKGYFDEYGIRFQLNADVRDPSDNLDWYLPSHCTYPVVYGTDRHHGAVLVAGNMACSKQVTVTLISTTDELFAIPLLGATAVLNTTFTYPECESYHELATAVSASIASLQTTHLPGYSRRDLIPDLKDDCVLLSELIQVAVPKRSHVVVLPALTAYIQFH